MLRANIASTPVHLGLLVITAAPLMRLVDGAACAVNFPAHQWQPRVAWEAAFAGRPNISIPLVGKGFNRTLNIDGFCNDVLMNPTYFTCSANNNEAGEFHATVTDPVNKPTSSKITFDDVNCPLKGISVRKTLGAQFEAEVRFQFEYCKAEPTRAASPVASAAVVMGLVKAPGRRSNLFPWMQEVCNVASTTPASASVVLSTKAKIVTVGAGKCKVPAGQAGGEAQATVTTQEGCKNACSGSIQTAEATGSTDGMCTGYAFSSQAPAGQQCLLYTTPVSEVSSTAAPGFTCFNMSMQKTDYVKNTPPPDAVQADLDLVQNLHLREVFSGAHATMTTAKLLQIQPQTGDDFCFPAAWWFMLQDDTGKAASMPVNEAEWAALMDMVPDPKTSHPAVRSTMIVDRVLVKTCNPNAAGWGRACDAPAVLKLCNYKQIVNACVTGLLTPILALAVVRCVFNTALGGARRVEIDQDKHEFPQCQWVQIVGLWIVTAVACGAFAAGISVGVSYAFGAAGCLHGVREMVVVGVATAVPAAICIIIGLGYIKLAPKGGANASSPASPESKQTPQYPAPGHKLVLAQVTEGQYNGPVSGQVINPDILQTGRSAMHSYLDQHPQNITVSNQGTGFGLPEGLGGSMFSTAGGFGFK